MGKPAPLLTHRQRELLEVFVRGHPVTFEAGDLAAQLPSYRRPGAPFRQLRELGLIEEASPGRWRASPAGLKWRPPQRAKKTRPLLVRVVLAILGRRLTAPDRRSSTPRSRYPSRRRWRS